MTDKPVKAMLESIARRGIPENPDLWPEIQRRLTQRKTFGTELRARPLAAILLVILVILLLTGAAYAIGMLTRYIPGIGFVEQSSLRVLAEPVSQTRLGVTVTIEQVAADAERTVIVYKTEGLTIQAANSRGESGGPSGFGSKHLLRLPDGRTFDETPFTGYAGTPEPILNQVQTEGGWPNYVYRLVYPAVGPQVNQLTLVIPVLENMPAGAAPENWEITFRLKAAPPEMTFAPIFQFTPQAGAAATGSTSSGTETASASNVSSLNGFTLRLDNVIETQDGYLFTGDLSWDTSIFPTGQIALSEDVTPTLTDAAGQNVPLEAVQMDAPYVEGHRPWSYRTNRKAFAGPLTFSIPSIQATLFAPATDFEIDLGPAPQIGQSWQFNHDFQVEGHMLRLLSVELRGPVDTCSSAALEFNFKADEAGMAAFVTDANPEPPSKQGCGGGGGGGGPVDPTLSSSAVSYQSLPNGPHHFSIVTAIPRRISGPWQVSWQPPMTSVVTVTAAREACLTREIWQQALGRTDPLPSGVSGKILTTVNEGGQLPAIYAQGLDGSLLGKFDFGSWASLSPDGTHLVYGAADAQHVLDLTNGQETSFRNDGYAQHWSPDNKRLLYTTTFGLYAINADGTEMQKIDTGSAQIISVVGWLPDNETVVYGAMGGAGFTFTSYNLRSGESKRLFTIQNKAGYGALSPDGQWIVFADRVFGADNWGIFISRLDGSDRRPVAAPDVSTAFTSVWGPGSQWLILNTRTAEGKDVAMLVNPFTCQAVKLGNINGMVEAWSP